MLAVGGNDVSCKSTYNVYRYDDSSTDSWMLTSHMATQRSQCLAASTEDQCLVVGRCTSGLSETDTIEIAYFL